MSDTLYDKRDERDEFTRLLLMPRDAAYDRAMPPRDAPRRSAICYAAMTLLMMPRDDADALIRRYAESRCRRASQPTEIRRERRLRYAVIERDAK